MRVERDNTTTTAAAITWSARVLLPTVCMEEETDAVYWNMHSICTSW